MKKVLLILAVLAMAVSAYAADASKGIEPGDKALLFNATFVNAGTYNGGLGLKYYLSQGLALRPVITFNMGSTTQKDENIDTVAGFQTTYEDDKTSTNSFGLELALEKTLLTKGAVNVNGGLGFGFGMSSYTREYGENYVEVGGTMTGVYNTKTERSSTNFGGGALLGAEWFITEAISLGAEYQLGIQMSSEGKDETTWSESYTDGGVTVSYSGFTRNPLTSTMDFGFQTVGLVLGIRF
ncbi:outer membrane beta-barrel protein [candidate division TA06 bacterium]|nr:outer membrane beta-barrel protein [candidate division TA06 bacterium]